MHEYHCGAALSIWLWPGAEQTWQEAEHGVRSSRAACPAQFRARMAHLADTGYLRSPDHMNSEGNGIFAIKATCGLRAYGWHDHYSGRRAFIVSHVVLKKQNKLDPAERARAEKAREEFRRDREVAQQKRRPT